MSSTSFLSEARKGHSSKSSRVVNTLAKAVQKLYTQNTVIRDPGLIDSGKTVKGRAIIQSGKLIYTRKITINPIHKVPEEPDGQFLVSWLKANHTGLFLKDFSKYNASHDDFEGGGGFSKPIIKVNNNRHLCLVDSGGLDLGYLGQHNGVNSVTAWDLNGTDESAQDINVITNNRYRIKDTVTGISIAAWVKVSDFSLHNNIMRRIVAKTDDADNAYALFVTPDQRIVFAAKHATEEHRVQSPTMSLNADTWYFICASFKSSATKQAIVYINAVPHTTAYTAAVTYPEHFAIPGTNIQYFGNGRKQLIDPNTSDLPPPHVFDTGDFKGQIRDIRIWREKILTQQEITNFNTNKVSITNLAFGESHIAGFVWSPVDVGVLSSFTSDSFSEESFNI